MYSLIFKLFFRLLNMGIQTVFYSNMPSFSSSNYCKLS